MNTTADRIRRIAGIKEVWHEGRPPHGDGWWAFTRAGWKSLATDCHTLHEDTVRELLADARNLVPCDCDDCSKAIAKGGER